MYTNEVRTLVMKDKNKKLPDIVSEDLKTNLFFVGNKHINGKIKGLGKVYNFELKLKFEGNIDENKYECTYFDSSEEENQLYINIFKFNKNSKTRCFLHQHELNYKVAKNDWICDFCKQQFTRDIQSFGCRKSGCNFYLCLNCLFTKENTVKGGKFKQLKNSNVDNVVYNTYGLLLNCKYHRHQFIYVDLNNTIINCFKCKKEIKGKDIFICNSGCNIYLCMDCIYNQDKERNLLISRLNNCIFKINLNNYRKDIYGYLIKGIKEDEIYYFINQSMENLKYYIKDYFIFNSKMTILVLEKIISYFIQFLLLNLINNW